MLQALVEWSLRNRLVVVVLAALLLGVGIYAAGHAHLDVVPARREDWSLDPWTLTERDGWFYGRGSGDNKAGAAMLVANLIRLKREGWRPLRDVIVLLTGDEETVVVGHSLGSVVTYNLLTRQGSALDWKVPLYVTVGCPLGISAIRRTLAPVRHPECAPSWFNARDNRDVVALFPLDAGHFDVDPAVVNKDDVDNDTANRHGISGYLSDAEVAKRVHDAVVG